MKLRLLLEVFSLRLGRRFARGLEVVLLFLSSSFSLCDEIERSVSSERSLHQDIAIVALCTRYVNIGDKIK
jgi:hypothetical protein